MNESTYSPLMSRLLYDLDGKLTEAQLENVKAAVKTKNKVILKGFLDNYGVKDKDRKDIIAQLLIDNSDAVYKLKPNEIKLKEGETVDNTAAIQDVFANIPEELYENKGFDAFTPQNTPRGAATSKPVEPAHEPNDVIATVGGKEYTVRDITFNGENNATATIDNQNFDVTITDKTAKGGSKKHKFTSKRHGGSKNSHKFTSKRYGGKKHHKFTSKRYGGNKKHSRRH